MGPLARKLGTAGLCLAAAVMAAAEDAEQIYTTILEQHTQTDVPALIRIRTPNDVEAVRDRLRELVFGTTELPRDLRPDAIEMDIDAPEYANLTGLRSIDHLTLTQPHGIDSNMYYFHAAEPNRRLVIYHQGHGGDFILGKSTITGLVAAGYDVVALAMPLVGPNRRPVAHVDGVGTLYIKNHEWMRFLDRPLGYFMRPILAAIQHAHDTKPYRDVSLVGLSGGGWSITLYAALDPRMAHTYQAGGTMPFFLRSGVPEEYGGHVGDFEQNYPPLVKTANYLELYVLGSAGPGRKQVQIINQFDRFAAHGIKYQLYEPHVAARVESLGMGGQFEVFLDGENREHSISEAALEHILDSLAAESSVAPPTSP